MKKSVKGLALLSAIFVLSSCGEKTISSSENSSNTESSLKEESSSKESSKEEIVSSSEESSSKEEISSSVDEGKVTGIKFVIKTINVDLNKTAQLEWKIYPSTAINKEVVFSVEDSSIASVSKEGEVTALALGSTIVTVTTLDGSFSDTATINVLGKQAEGIKLILPSGMIQDENGYYLIKVDQRIQLSYQMNPENSINSVTYSTSTSSGDAAAYLSVSKSGMLTGRKLKVKITVSVTTDNLFTDSVNFSVVKDSIYSKYLLQDTLRKSTALEKENIVSGNKKIIHKKKKSSIDDETNETFNIYTNGVARNYTEKDNYLNKEKTYEGFYGIYDDKFYQISRNGSDYNGSSVADIGDGAKEISLETAKEYSSLAYYRTRYGLANIIQAEYMDSSLYFGYSGTWLTYDLNVEGNKISLVASFEKIASAYYETSYFRSMSLTIDKNDDGMILGYSFVSNDYDSSSYDFTNHVLNDSPTATETYEHTFTQVSGERSENESFSLEPSQCYFKSYDVKVSSSVDSSTDLYVGDYIKFEVENPSPSTATTTIDRVSFLSSSNEKVILNSSSGGLRAVGEGETTLTFTSSNGVTSTKTVTVNYKSPESVSINCSALGVKVGETLDDITTSVSPYGAKNDVNIAIVSGEEYATLSFDETKQSYSLKGLAKGKVVLEGTSNIDSSLKIRKTLYVYEEISEDEVLSTLLANKYSVNASNSKTYILQFLADGKGRIVDGFESYSTTYGTFEYSISSYTVTVTNVKSANTSYLYALENLTLSNNGLTLTGKMQTSSSTYSKQNYTFTIFDE